LARPARTAKHRQAAVVGIHTLPFAKDIGMTERHSGALAILGALQDAGLKVSDVDAMFRYYWENTTEMEMARILGVRNLRMFGEVDYGGGAGPPTVQLAALAIENNLADVVVLWRARNRGSGGRPGEQYMATGDQFGPTRRASRQRHGISFRYWLHKYGWTRVTGRVAVTRREHARRNPRAHAKPMTMERTTSRHKHPDPLRLFDSCLETDGALAMVLTSADRAQDPRRPPT
jgi:acetyl-CoA acetyltransferase